MTDIRLSYPRLLALLVLLALQLQLRTTASAQGQAPKQHFVCNIGYTPQECAVDMAILRKALTKYPVEALGDWTWVLVRTEDWKRILSERGFNPDISPAFSILPQRETFIEGALAVKGSSRGVLLSGLWHMPIEDLLDLAVRHEIAHALCNDRNEAKANRAALALKNGEALSCQSALMVNVMEEVTRKHP